MPANKREKSNRILEFSFTIPLQFQLLCKLTEIDPQKVLYDFMCNAGMEGYGLGEQAKAKAMEYFIACGYGQQHYPIEDIRRILKELESISGLFPSDAEMTLIDIHSQWREEYYKF